MEHVAKPLIAVKNYVIGELKRYVRSNTKQTNFLGMLFNKVKLSDRTDLLLSPNSCDIPILQMTPEHFLERNLISEWDNRHLAEAYRRFGSNNRRPNKPHPSKYAHGGKRSSRFNT